MPLTAEETILIFAANPSSQRPLRLDYEVREIQNGLRHSRQRFNLQQVWATRPKDLRRALLDHQPTYVHFCGHGTGRSGIVLEDTMVSASALAGLFALFSPRIRCVVLNACYSAVQAQAIVQHVDYVVGMNRAIGDAAAIEFASAFYDALGAGQSVEFAFSLGCNAIELAGIPEHLTPRLLTRTEIVKDRPGLKLDQPTRVIEDWDGAPAVAQLFGRENEAEMLRSWILGDLCRVVLIMGLGGVGKTDLVTCVGRGGNQWEGTSAILADGIRNHFETVVWRSLLNAPLPEDLFTDILGVLTAHGRPLATSTQGQVEMLLSCLQDRQCLLILDNVESILAPSDSLMRCKEGYEAYATLFEQMGKLSHRSCLLLTSREKPRAVAELEGVRKPVRSLVLTGIGTEEGKALFAQIGEFVGVDSEWDRLIKLYHGNPLALELAARHIEQVFGGDLSAFLNSGHSVFSGLAELLDWHLDRLSAEEVEVVFWLAIAREPVRLADLEAEIVSPGASKTVASTVQTLQRRIPLERTSSAGFSLQPVLLEHVTTRLVEDLARGLQRAGGELLRNGGLWETLSDAAQQALRLFDSYPLLKATDAEHVRRSQKRLILEPIGQRLANVWRGNVRTVSSSILDALRSPAYEPLGYAAGNLINLLSYWGESVSGLDFSHLPISQACLHEASLQSVDFAHCTFRRNSYRHPFGVVFGLSYRPDGKVLALGDDHGEVRTLDVTTGQLEMRCIGHSDVVWSVSHSPDGSILATASFDNTIRLWSSKTGHCQGVLMGHSGWVYDVAFSPTGKSLASVSEDGTCRIWNLQRYESVPCSVREDYLAAVAFNPDGSVVAVGGARGVVSLVAVDAPQSQARELEHGSRVRALCFAPSGGVIATAGDDGSIHLWLADTGTRLGTLNGHTGHVSCLAFNITGEVLVSGSVDGTVRLWRTESWECVGQMLVGDARVVNLACSPSENSFASASEDGAVRVWSIDTCECLASYQGYSNTAWSVAFARRGTRLLAAYEDATLRAWNLRDGEIDAELRGHSTRVWAVASDGDLYGASGSDDLTVRLWDLSRSRCRDVLVGHTDWIRALAFHPRAEFLASCAEDGQVLVWKVSDGSLQARIKCEGTRILVALAFCLDGSVIATGGAGATVYLYGVSDGRCLRQLSGHTGWVSAIATPSPEAPSAASCSEDGTVRFWDLLSGECTQTIVVGARLWCGAFFDRGLGFIAGDETGVVRLWQFAEEHWQMRSCIQAHEGAVWSIAVDEASAVAATSGNDGCIRSWRLPTMEPELGRTSLRPPRPYEGMNISGATGLMPAQRQSLLSLGAIEIPTGG